MIIQNIVNLLQIWHDSILEVQPPNNLSPLINILNVVCVFQITNVCLHALLQFL